MKHHMLLLKNTHTSIKNCSQKPLFLNLNQLPGQRQSFYTLSVLGTLQPSSVLPSRNSLSSSSSSLSYITKTRLPCPYDGDDAISNHRTDDPGHDPAANGSTTTSMNLQLTSNFLTTSLPQASVTFVRLKPPDTTTPLHGMYALQSQAQGAVGGIDTEKEGDEGLLLLSLSSVVGMMLLGAIPSYTHTSTT